MRVLTPNDSFSPHRNLSVKFANLDKSSGLMDISASWSSPEGHYEMLAVRLTTEEESQKQESAKHIVMLPKVTKIILFTLSFFFTLGNDILYI